MHRDRFLKEKVYRMKCLEHVEERLLPGVDVSVPSTCSGDPVSEGVDSAPGARLLGLAGAVLCGPSFGRPGMAPRALLCTG